MPTHDPAAKPDDHDARLESARLALDGLSVGDAFGERFFGPDASALERIEARRLAPPPWGTTDDTEMAVAITDVLAHHAAIDRDVLAREFARRWAHDPARGYGAGAHRLLGAIHLGGAWRELAADLFGGSGSFGNGGAMRAAPVGAYFAHESDARIVAQASASAEVTHAHPEGRAGAVAVALAAAHAARTATEPRGASAPASALLDFVLAAMPASETKHGVARARALPFASTVDEAARVLGVGERVSAMDTVPFALWCAARHLDDFEQALWTTVRGLGDRDTTCAIVGGIVALASPASIPRAWLEAREALTFAPSGALTFAPSGGP